jgi:Ca-activated chloride channel family protein
MRTILMTIAAPISLETPLALLSLLLVAAAIAAYVFAQRRPPRAAVAYTNLDVLAAVAGRSPGWRRHVPPALFFLALALIGIALARPHVPVTVAREQATVVLAIDSSASMLAEDVPPSRFEAAQQAVRTFLDELPEQYRVGMVMFAADTQVVAPVTRNRDLVYDALDLLFPLRGTAIGDAVSRSAELAREAVGPLPETRLISYSAQAPPVRSPAVVLFLSDGFQTAGTLQPLEGAARAKELGIPVYTIALGTLDGVVEFGFGFNRRSVPVPPDRETLRLIASETGGRYYAAPTADALSSAYADLRSRLSEEPGEAEATVGFVGAAAAVLIAALALGALWAVRIP